MEDEFESNVDGVFSGDGGSGSGDEGHNPSGDQRQQQRPSDWRRWGRAEGSATSGLGFMSALQRAIILEQQPQHHAGEGSGGGGDSLGDDRAREEGIGGKDAGGDGHALELLSIIAACCEVRVRQDGLFRVLAMTCVASLFFFLVVCSDSLCECFC